MVVLNEMLLQCLIVRTRFLAQATFFQFSVLQTFVPFRLLRSPKLNFRAGAILFKAPRVLLLNMLLYLVGSSMEAVSIFLANLAIVLYLAPVLF